MKRIWIIILAIIVALSTSCMKSTKKDSAQLAQDEKAPEDLVAVMEGINEILHSMSDIERTFKLTPSEFEALYPVLDSEKKTSDNKNNDGEEKAKKEEENKKDGDNEEDKNEDKDKSDTGDKEKTEIKDEKILKTWKTVDDKIEKIHKDWNNYQPKSIKKGAEAEKGKDLNRNMNSFTEAIEARDPILIMDRGSKSLAALSHYFDLYKDEILGDLVKIRHIAYQAYLKANGKDIKGADELLGKGEEYITRIRQRLDKNENKDKREALDKLSLSIEDMKQSLKTPSIKLLEIKRDIILENIQGLQN